MKKENSKLSGYMLIALFVVPLIIAIILYVNRDNLPSRGTVQHGELIHPAEPINEIQILSAQNITKSLKDVTGKWTYLFYSPKGCGLECEATLFKLRQAKIATGRDANRIQLMIVLDSKQLERNIAMRNKSISVGQLIKLELESAPGVNKALEQGVTYLIDPFGNMMMRYDKTSTSRGMLKDIKKLLKLSNIG